MDEGYMPIGGMALGASATLGILRIGGKIRVKNVSISSVNPGLPD